MSRTSRPAAMTISSLSLYSAPSPSERERVGVRGAYVVTDNPG